MEDQNVTQQDLLTQAVIETTGLPDAKPRAPQATLSRWIERAFAAEGKHLAAQAPTGTGKSITYLTPAFRAAVEHRQRTLITTEGLALQRQIITKDAPAVAKATEAIYGSEPQVAVLKGFSNYVCGEAATETAQRVLRQAGQSSNEDLFTRLTKVKDALGKAAPMKISGIQSTVGTLVDLLTWALMHSTDAINGQRDECPVPMDREWSLVSVPSGQCSNDEDPYNACAGHQARMAAAAADIVVTNHTLVAIQATKNIPVLVDSKTLGAFDHIIIDEAHALPSVVRSNGAVEISEPRITRALNRIIDSDDPDAQPSPMVKTAGAQVKELLPFVTQAINTYLGDAKTDEEVWIEEDEEFAELDALGVRLASLKEAVKDDGMLSQDIRMRHVSSIESLIDDIDLVSTTIRDTARWAIRQSMPSGGVVASFAASPIDVSSNLFHRLWTRDPMAHRIEDSDKAQQQLEEALQSLEDDQDITDVDANPERVRSTVVAVSATLSDDFPYEAGLRCDVVDVETPFAEAYDQSAIYIPYPEDEDLDVIANDRWGKLRMDTKLHHDWAKEHMLELIFANRGAAMVICATSTAAKAYAQAIEDDPHLPFNVYTQWDRRGRAQAIEDWKNDVSSVIVGTRSLMTGVDASGVTNTLVVIDRPARAPMNPVDKARCAALIEAGVNRWAADTRIYVQDAAVLLEQAAGRLIRCFDLETEILTTDGWKSYNEIKVGDTVYGIPPQMLKARGTRTATSNGAPSIEQHQVKAIKVNDEPEPLLRFKNRVADIVATPDHTMFVQPQEIRPINTRADGSKEYYVSKSPDYMKTRFDSLPHRFQLPLAGRVSRGQSKLPRDWFTLLGLVISDGYISKYKNSIALSQSTAKQAVVDEIDELLGRMDIKFNRYVQEKNGTKMSIRGGKEYTRNGDIITWVINGHDSSRIRDLLVLGQRRRKSEVKSHRSVQYSAYRDVWNWLDAEKVIPRWIINTASRPNLLALFRGLMLGDGTYSWFREGKSGTFYTGTKLNADRFQEICALVGYRSNIVNRSETQWEVRFAARGSVNTTRKDIAEHGIGKTWCVNTELGSVVARRNGRTFIAGNSANDRGMVAVLDPRLRPGSPISYNAATRKMYLEAVDVYGHDMDHLDDALDWLEERAEVNAEQVAQMA
ncbi:helicase C-terminal domain-containing protein [Yaniella flava]